MWQTFIMHKFSIKDTDVVIIPEQHLYHKPIATIPEMVKDNNDIINKLYSIIDSLVNPIVIFIGDIVHQGIKTTEDSYFIDDFFRMISLKTNGKVLSVVGNHELTYKKNNPFWGVAYIDSEFINSIVKHTYSIRQPLIGVVDDLVINDTQYAFGHYGRNFYQDYNVYDGVNQVVLLSHTSLICDEILESFNNKGKGIDKRFIKTNNLRSGHAIPRTKLLKYVYVGHLHKAHGVFEVEENICGIKNKFLIRYLASLGRTNHSEYDDDLIREIPIHVFRDGKFIEEHLETIELPKRSESVDERVVLENRESYDRQKHNRELKKIESFNTDLIQSINDYLEDKPDIADLFQRAYTNEFDVEVIKLLEKYGW